MTYTIELAYESGERTLIPLHNIKSRRMAVTAIKNWLDCGNARGKAYLTFFRASDGQHGYVNPREGCSPTGIPWNA